VQPLWGRAFALDEYREARSHAVIWNEELYKRRFSDSGNNAFASGRSLRLNEVSYDVVGVMPESFRLAPSFVRSRVQLWLPMGDNDLRRERGSHGLRVVGRLKPRVELTQAAVELETIAKRLAETYPDQQTGRSVRVEYLREEYTKSAKPSLMLLLGAVGAAFAIACANVAGLLLARGAARQGEFAIRLALGASRRRIVRQLLTESVLLGLLGGAAGLVVALWATDGLKVALARQINPAIGLELDGRVLGIGIILSLAGGVGFGVIPAWLAARSPLDRGLKQAAARASMGRDQQRFWKALVVGQLALSVALLATTGWLIRSLKHVQDVNSGFDPSGVYTLRLALSGARYPDDAQRERFATQVLEALDAVPGVASSGLVNHLPLSRTNVNGGFTIEGRAPWRAGEAPDAEYLAVSPRYFQTMAMRLVQGRAFANSDTKQSLPVVMINQTMANRFWPNDNPIGKRIRIGWDDNEQWREIVAVVADVKRWALDKNAVPETYVPFRQVPLDDFAVVVKAAANTSSTFSAMRDAVYSVDPNQPIYDVQTMSDVVAESLASRRWHGGMMGVFAVMALVLAAVGLYGIMAYHVRQKTAELGIRLALGAQPRAVWRQVMREGGVLVACGVALGAAFSVASARLVRPFLFGVEPIDPATILGVAFVLGGIAMIAICIPALRASRIDPMLSLRCE